MDKERIIKEANEYINNEYTLKETATHLGISIRTLQLHLQKLKEIDPKLHQLVLNKQKSNINAGRKKGGEIGKKTKTYKDEEAMKIAKIMLEKALTYREAEELLHIPKSTIYEMVHSEYIDAKTIIELDLLAEANNKDRSVAELIGNRK